MINFAVRAKKKVYTQLSIMNVKIATAIPILISRLSDTCFDLSFTIISLANDG